jgi:molybdopterin/thiamine biosynthesis adenylyltransferase
MEEHDWTYEKAFSRNVGLIPSEHQEKLRKARVAIAGLGGVGGIYATTLTRLGVGNFSILDAGTFELAHTSLEHGAYVSTIGKPKAETLRNMILDINPEAHVRFFDSDTQGATHELLQGATLVLDALDFFAITERRTLYKAGKTNHLPVLGAAPVAFGASMLNFSPEGMDFDTYFAINDAMNEQDQLFQFALGITPLMLQRPYFDPQSIDFRGKKAPSSVLGTMACANLLVCEAYKVIAGLPYEVAPVSWHFDPYVRKLRRCNLWWGNRNPIQLAKKLYFKRKLGFM